MQTLSIIIPAYNEEKTIHLILDKVLAVKLVNDLQKEIVIVNDCSTDKTKDVLRAYISNTPLSLSIAVLRRNYGAAIARNIGITHAKGNLVAFTDDDCVVPSDWLFLFKEKMESKVNTLLIFLLKPCFSFLNRIIT